MPSAAMTKRVLFNDIRGECGRRYDTLPQADLLPLLAATFITILTALDSSSNSKEQLCKHSLQYRLGTNLTFLFDCPHSSLPDLEAFLVDSAPS